MAVISASLILRQWEIQVKTRSEKKEYVFGNERIFEAPYKVFLYLQKEVDQRLEDVLGLWSKSLRSKVTVLVSQWNRGQLHQWVGRLPHNTHRSATVELTCGKVTGCLRSLLESVSSVGFERLYFPLRARTPDLSALHSLVDEALSELLVIHQHPWPVIDMETASAHSSDKATGGQSKKKGTTRSSNGKKDNPVNTQRETTVGILGGGGFGEGLVMTDVKVGLELNSVLSRSPYGAWERKHLKTVHCKQDEGEPGASWNRKLSQLRLEHFTRERAADVWRQLYFFVYFVTLHLTCSNGYTRTLQLQVLSFPLMVRTAANQALELMGAHLWHTFSAQNVRDLAQEVVLSLPVESVVTMLNQRFAGISPRRQLRPYERDFLRHNLEKIMRARLGNRSPTDVTLEAFIKQPVTFPHVPSPEKKFSFWQWLQAIINLLEKTLLQPWIDGMIHGLAGHEWCREMLKGEEEGTFLFKFSESMLSDNHTCSQAFLNTVIMLNESMLSDNHTRSQTFLNTVVTLNSFGLGYVHFVKADSAAILEKHGLTHYMKNTQCQFLYGSQKTITVQTLTKRYSPPSDPNQTPDYYIPWSELLNRSLGEPVKRKRPKSDRAQSAVISTSPLVSRLLAPVESSVARLSIAGLDPMTPNPMTPNPVTPNPVTTNPVCPMEWESPVCVSPVPVNPAACRLVPVSGSSVSGSSVSGSSVSGAPVMAVIITGSGQRLILVRAPPAAAAPVNTDPLGNPAGGVAASPAADGSLGNPAGVVAASPAADGFLGIPAGVVAASPVNGLVVGSTVLFTSPRGYSNVTVASGSTANPAGVVSSSPVASGSTANPAGVLSSSPVASRSTANPAGVVSSSPVASGSTANPAGVVFSSPVTSGSTANPAGVVSSSPVASGSTANPAGVVFSSPVASGSTANPAGVVFSSPVASGSTANSAGVVFSSPVASGSTANPAGVVFSSPVASGSTANPAGVVFSSPVASGSTANPAGVVFSSPVASGSTANPAGVVFSSPVASGSTANPAGVVFSSPVASGSTANPAGVFSSPVASGSTANPAGVVFSSPVASGSTANPAGVVFSSPVASGSTANPTGVVFSSPVASGSTANPAGLVSASPVGGGSAGFAASCAVSGPVSSATPYSGSGQSHRSSSVSTPAAMPPGSEDDRHHQESPPLDPRAQAERGLAGSDPQTGPHTEQGHHHEVTSTPVQNTPGHPPPWGIRAQDPSGPAGFSRGVWGEGEGDPLAAGLEEPEPAGLPGGGGPRSSESDDPLLSDLDLSIELSSPEMSNIIYDFSAENWENFYADLEKLTQP